MTRKLEMNEHMIANTCTKGLYYSKYKYTPFDIELVKYDNDTITMRAYGKVYDDEKVDYKYSV